MEKEQKVEENNGEENDEVDEEESEEENDEVDEEENDEVDEEENDEVDEEQYTKIIDERENRENKKHYRIDKHGNVIYFMNYIGELILPKRQHGMIAGEFCEKYLHIPKQNRSKLLSLAQSEYINSTHTLNIIHILIEYEKVYSQDVPEGINKFSEELFMYVHKYFKHKDAEESARSQLCYFKNLYEFLKLQEDYYFVDIRK